MGNLKCKRCRWIPVNESDLHEHHIIPKKYGGTDKDGRMYLCGDDKGLECHRVIHKIIREEERNLKRKPTKEELYKLTIRWL